MPESFRGYLVHGRKDDLVTRVPEIEDGYLKLPSGPGWRTELDEEAIRAHPPGRPH